MTEVVSFKTGAKYLTPSEIFKNATKDGQTKILIASMDDKGNVKVFSTDMKPMELLYLAQAADHMAGNAALQDMNAEYGESF